MRNTLSTILILSLCEELNRSFSSNHKLHRPIHLHLDDNDNNDD